MITYDIAGGEQLDDVVQSSIQISRCNKGENVFVEFSGIPLLINETSTVESMCNLWVSIRADDGAVWEPPLGIDEIAVWNVTKRCVERVKIN